MNQYLENLIKLGTVVAGKIINEDGFIIFERENDFEKLKEINEDELAFATTSMGRAIFKIDTNGKIIKFKGVDSHLDNTEIAPIGLVSAEAAYIPNENKSYQNSTYPLNLVVFQGKRPDIRIRGASPLEDLEIEADINSRMQGNGIKLLKIISVREFSEDFALKYGLPIKVDGSFTEFNSDYIEENSKRKKTLKENYGENYQEVIIEGKRPETLGEYFRRIGIFERQEIIEFAQKNNMKIQDFIEYVDSSYSLGQRYGQAKRQIQNPFRISDIEYYTKLKNIKVLENIISFSENLQETDEPFENYFAKQMGKNLGNMLNSGWVCENFVHRQDYTLAGEMCDDSYQYLPDKLKDAQKHENGKRQAIQIELKKKYFYQIYALGSTIKVLEDEMKLRGKTTEETQSVFDDFIKSFIDILDFDKASSFVNADAKKVLEELVKRPTNFEKILASKTTKNGIVYDEEILFAHKGSNAFFDKVSSGIANALGIQRDFYSEKPKTEPDEPGEK